MEEITNAGKKKSLAGKIGRIFLKSVLIIVLFLVMIALLILTPPVQSLIRKKATAWLTNKLHTRVELGKIYIGFPKNIVLENIYVEDRQKDTLLAGGQIKVDISMLKLFRSQVEINQITLSEITAKVKRVLPDTTYNFQFIIDAFASKKPAAASKQDTSSMDISVRGVNLDKIRLVYNDVVSGNDITFWLDHFDTEINVFDMKHMHFDVPTTNIKGIKSRVFQHKPLVVHTVVAVDTGNAVAAVPVKFNFNTLNLSDINLDYGNDVSSMYTKLDLGKLTVHSDNIDLQNKVISLKGIQLDNTTANVRMGKTGTPAPPPVKVAEDSASSGSGWKVLVKNISFNNNNIAFTDDNKPVLKKGMDYSHLDAKGITLHVNNLLYTPDTISGAITKGLISEKSGFRLNTFQTEFLYASNQAHLKGLLIETPGTTIRRSAELRYPSLTALKKDIGKLQLNLDIYDSKVQVKDILTFVPSLSSQPAFADPNSTIFFNGNITGSVADMNIRKLQIRGFSNTDVDLRGTVAGLPDSKKVKGNLVINTFRTSRKDIQMLAPKGSLPKNITIPENISLRGTIAGSMSAARASLDLTTSLGNASLNGSIANTTDKQRAKYNATLNANQLNLGVIMQNDSMFGPLTATIIASGTGFDPKTASANVKATIISAVLNRYNYKDVQLTAGLAKQKANVDLVINDPNIDIALTGTGDLAGRFPVVAINAVINTIKPNQLHFTKDTLDYKGTINADFPNTDPANLEGRLLITKSLLTTPTQKYALDTIAMTAGKTDSGKFVRLRSDELNFAVTGKYNLAQLGAVFTQAIQPYYALSPGPPKPDTLQDYDFHFNAQVVDGPLLKIFAPTLTHIDPVTLQSHFVKAGNWVMNIDAPLIIMGTKRIQKLQLRAGTSNGAILFSTNMQQFTSGATMKIYATNVNARIANNKVNFLINLKDINNKNKYRIGGLFEQPQNGVYALNLNPDSLMLNYNKWNIAANNQITLNKGDINISNFIISWKGQALSINSTSPNTNSPLELKFDNFRIGTITAFAKQDSALADGVVNGGVVVKNIAQQPVFTSDITIKDLTFRTDTVGNLVMKVNNAVANTYAADVSLTGKGNDIALKGNYHVKPANQSSIDLNMDIRALQMTSIQAFSMGAMNRAKGFINGKFVFAGTFKQPHIDGNLNFNQVGFSPTMLGSYFNIDKQSIVVNSQGVAFNSFTIRDSANNQLNLDGNAYSSDFINYKLDLNLSATNFQALNSSKQNSRLFYGQFFFDTDLHIGGTDLSPVVDGDLTVNENTKFTVVLPQSQPGMVEREGIVKFVDMDSVQVDTTLSLTQADSLSKSDIMGMDIAVNIEIKKEAEMTLIIDEGNGDFLRMKGAAQLSGGIDPSGKTTLTGTYEIDQGAYQLSFNMIKRKFDIKKGSKITWLGEPTKANIDLTALYIANTAPITLVENQVDVPNINIYKQKLPFEVDLALSGDLMKPDIKFDVLLPTTKTYNVDASVIDIVDTRLSQLRSEPSELNKQVFALLLLNRFVAENPFASSGDGSGFNAGTMARQSVSRLLSEQLNSLASDLIKGVDLNFDLASQEDYTKGSMQNRTDLNVSLSKQLLNDRLKVTVGSNFELEGPQNTNQRQNNLAGDVGLDYMLSKDGRYLIRAYRKNQYQGYLEGYIIESGLNFIMRFDYDKLRELFHSPRKPLRRILKEQRKNNQLSEADKRKASIKNGSSRND